ncbi:MAG TPA: SCO family protein [Bacillus bacterium]|nr:SCO family protein [Bacillus sp. (in: firmicutes)]
MNLNKRRTQIGILLLVFSLLVVTACNQPKFQAKYDWPMADFSAINQDNEKFGPSDMKGKIWLANFVFTNCNSVCPPMTANMARLQRQMAEAKIKDVDIVSFSVDPERDTPEALKEFASKFEADLSNWQFLTGYTGEDIKRIAKSFKTLAEAEPGTDQFTHDTKIFLINEDGIIVKGYNGLQVQYDEIIADLKALTK